MAGRDAVEVAIGDRSYLVGPIAPRPMFHLTRRLAPVFATLGPALLKLEEIEKAIAGAAARGDAPEADAEPAAGADDESAGLGLKEALAAGAAAIEAVGAAVASLSDKDADYVLDGLLRNVRVVETHGRGFSPMFQGDRFMYPDTPLPVQLELAGRSLWFNLESFFGALPSAFKERVTKAAGRWIG